MSGDLNGTIWGDVVSAALLGTQRRQWTGTNVPDLPPLPGGAEGLLHSAALLTAWREAGRTVAPPPFPVPTPPPPDPRPVLGPEPRRLLTTILRDRRHAALLDEWLGLAAAGGCRLPGALLPDLIAVAGLDDAVRRDRLQALGGPLLRWLAGQNPDWAAAAPDEVRDVPIDGWNDASDEARLATFRRLRAADPPLAAALLAEIITAEPAVTAVALIENLSAQLSEDDVGVLELALDDRRKRVRAAAAELLDRLPSSPRAQRLAALIVPTVAVTGRLRRGLAIGELPPSDEAQKRDGIVGPPDERFVLAVTGAALDAWATQLGQAPVVLVHLAVASPDPSARLLLAGWAAAASRQRDRGWVRALLDGGALPDDTLLAVLDRDEADRSLADAVGASGLAELPSLINACAAPWGPVASAEAMTAIAKIVAKVDLSKRPDIALTQAALALQASLAPLALQLHPRTDVTPLIEATARGPSATFWQAAVAGSGSAVGLAGTLAFRAALHSAFASTPTSTTPPRSLS